MNTTMIQPKSISTVIAGYGEKLYAFIRSRVPGEEDAKDVLQEVWVQLINQSSLEDIAHMSGWLYQVARNKMADLYRKQSKDKLEYLFTGDQLIPESMTSTTPDPADLEWKEIFYDQLMKALEELPAGQREVFISNELEDMTLQQIADQTGWSIKTIISRKRYAVQYLRKRLAHYYEAFLKN